MVENLVTQLWHCFKDEYGVVISESADLFESQRNILKFVVGFGRKLEKSLFDEIGTGREGAIIEREDKRYDFSSYRSQTINVCLAGLSTGEPIMFVRGKEPISFLLMRNLG